MGDRPRFLYRGVHMAHPAHAAALQGTVEPGNPAGRVTPEDHNVGGFAAESPFTSWTNDERVARWFAMRKGPGGVLLSLPFGAPQTGDTWSWEFANDAYYEGEVLLRGVRIGAKAEVLQ